MENIHRANRDWDYIDKETLADEEREREIVLEEQKIQCLVVDVETHDWREGQRIVTPETCIGRIVEI